jgi:Rieske Fe-S protein
MQTESGMTRRECLSWLGRAVAGALAAGCARQCAHADDKGGTGEGLVKVADLMRLRNDSAVEIDKPEVILSRTAQGVAAFEPYCTHRRNKLSVGKDGAIFCPVHGSNFDGAGRPVSGPAARELGRYLTHIDDSGAVSVNTSKKVPSGQWAELPGWAKPKK